MKKTAAAVLGPAALTLAAILPADSFATHFRIILGSVVHHFQPASGSVTLVAQHGQDQGHLPSYDIRAYGYSAGYRGSPSSPLAEMNVSARWGVSCNNGATWSYDGLRVSSVQQQLATSAYSGGWLALPGCDSYPKYAVATTHYYRPSQSISESYQKECFMDERSWFAGCTDVSYHPQPSGGGGVGPYGRGFI